MVVKLLEKPIAKLKIKNENKYFQTLEGHTEDALKILKVYILKNYEVINQFCKKWSLNKKKFIEALFLTVYFHDIGKLTKEFQYNIKQNKGSQKYPHAYYGFFLLNEFFSDQVIENVSIELAVILGHHTQLYNQIYIDDNMFETPTFLEKEIILFINETKNIHKKLGFDKFFNVKNLNIKIPQFNWNALKKLRNGFIYRINNYLSDVENLERIKLKAIFSYFFSILQVCDDFSSIHFSRFIKNYSGNIELFSSVIKNPAEYIPELNIDKYISKIVKNKKLYKFQKDLLDASEFTTLFAPCGRGKTEASLLWALSTLKKLKRNRIIFAMPTQTTSNATYDRLKAIFGKENVGLYHGRSFIKLKDDIINEKNNDFEEEKDIEYIKSETFKGNIFLKPITITTIDHLLYSFVKGFRQADFALGCLQSSVIIFDEVHYYEKLTLEHLLTLFKLLIKMDVPHLLMSGTLPNFIIEELSNYYKHIVDEEGLKFRPFNLEFFEKSIFNSNTQKEIIENYKKGLTQFIILNTVKGVKLFYTELKKRFKGINKLNMMLYHSQFIYRDRVKKENEIYERIKRKPFILVATQVIEISLDISCDIMYSECAPPDAIGQRAGRLNRKGKNWKNDICHTLKIYKPEKFLPYVESLMRKVLLNIKNYQRPLNYKEIRDFCDKVYLDYLLDIPSDLEFLYKECTIFGYNWRDITFDGEEGRRFMVRDEKVQYIDVIPESIYKNKGDDSLKVENVARIPVYLLLKDKKEDSEYFYRVVFKKGNRIEPFWICRYPYNYEFGFEYNNQNEGIFIV